MIDTKRKSRIVIKDLPADRKITIKEMRSIHGGVMDTLDTSGLLTETLLTYTDASDDAILRKRPGRVKY